MTYHPDLPRAFDGDQERLDAARDAYLDPGPENAPDSATSATEGDFPCCAGSGYRSSGDRPADGRTAVRTFFDDDGEDMNHRITVRKRDGRWSWRCTCTVWSVPPFTNTQTAALRWGCMHLSLICVASKFGHVLRKASTARQSDFTLAGPAKADR